MRVAHRGGGRGRGRGRRQDPANADKLLKVQRELDETKVVLVRPRPGALVGPLPSHASTERHSRGKHSSEVFGRARKGGGVFTLSGESRRRAPNAAQEDSLHRCPLAWQFTCDATRRDRVTAADAVVDGVDGSEGCAERGARV